MHEFVCDPDSENCHPSDEDIRKMRGEVEKSRRHFLSHEDEWCPSSAAPLEAERGPSLAALGACDPDTGGTCNIANCSLHRGPTRCAWSGTIWGYKCFCRDGLCPNADGVCTALGTVTADVVPVSAARPAFPGRHAGVVTGLCFSGGGIRAMTWALGGLRPLVEWGLMEKVDIISSVSGGSWANAIYMFAPGDTQTILGGPTDPANLTMGALNRQPAPAVQTATNDWTGIMRRFLLRGAPLDTLWQFYVCEAFLEPFGLCDFWAHLAPDEDAVAQIKSANPQLMNASFQHPRADRPRALVFDGTKLAPLGYTTDAADAVSFQMSPDYIGTPFYAGENETEVGGYRNYSSLNSNGPDIRRLVGGGFVQAFAFGGSPSPEGQGGGKGITLGAPPWPFSLAQAIGISSMAVAGALEDTFIGKLVNPHSGEWPLTDDDHHSEHGLLVSELSDGGNEDNSGLLALLQRGVKRVVWFAASYKLVNRSYDLCAANTSDDELIRAGVIDQVLDKFGYGAALSQGSLSNAIIHNQVFARQGVHDVACQLQQHLTSGTPPVLRFTEEVLRNDWWGIAGGWTVDIVLVYLEHSGDFEAQLPKDTRAQFDRGIWGAFPGYPAYKTAGGGGTNAQYNLLAATSEYFVRQNQDLMRSILS